MDYLKRDHCVDPNYGIYVFKWDHYGEGNEESDFRIYPIFREGVLLFDGYNYKIDNIGSDLKKQIKMTWSRDYFNEEKYYFLLKSLMKFEEENNGRITFMSEKIMK